MVRFTSGFSYFPRMTVVGLQGRYALTDEIIFNSSFNFMILSFDNWSGDIYMIFNWELNIIS